MKSRKSPPLASKPRNSHRQCQNGGAGAESAAANKKICFDGCPPGDLQGFELLLLNHLPIHPYHDGRGTQIMGSQQRDQRHGFPFRDGVGADNKHRHDVLPFRFSTSLPGALSPWGPPGFSADFRWCACPCGNHTGPAQAAQEFPAWGYPTRPNGEPGSNLATGNPGQARNHRSHPGGGW